MNNELFNAILALDAYNRGYEHRIILSSSPDSLGQRIGNATVINESDIDDGSDGVNVGFYALAYSYDDDGDGNNSTIISYRGTVDFDSAADLLTSKDVVGWLLGVEFW